VSSLTEEIPRLIKVELIAEPSINAGVGVSLVTTVELRWMDPIIEFLTEDRVPTNEKEAEKVHRTTTQYWLLADRKLYRRSFEGSTCSVCTPIRLKSSWPSYMRECAAVT